jgi:tetratricopeptide (TPR) repeat protein
MNFFPSPYIDQPLSESDFNRFRLPFSQILKKKILTVSKIHFLTEKSEINKYINDPGKIGGFREILNQVRQNPDIVYSLQDYLFLPFPLKQTTIIAVIEGVDPFFIKKADREWLIEMRNNALNDFYLLKLKSIDPDTGLLNANILYDQLEILKQSPVAALMLIELYPRVRTSSEAILYSRRAALSLTNFSDNRFPIYYLGHGIFALIVPPEESTSHIGAMLISWLRREGFFRVHIGSSRKNASELGSGVQLLEEAWQALQVACRRGPFSFCDFSLLAHPEQHLLCRPSRQVLTKLSRKWRNSRSFSVVLLQIEKGDTLGFSKHFLFSVDEDTIVLEKNDIYIFLESTDSRQALAWVQQRISDSKPKLSTECLFYVGIGTFPYADFAKTEIPFNCRKALIHAGFFGPGSVVVFDAVSLNVSGDIFYGDGDLKSAVLEYKRGLVCDENNINLLNSLGVAYAMIDRQKMAHHCFNKVLALDPDNFMALYNLGLGEDLLGHNESARSLFERAINIHPDGPEGMDMTKDLQFQLGRLFCITGYFQKAVDILLLWYKDAKDSKNAGRAFRYLGIAFHGLNNKNEAMTWLQRALQFDEFDAEVMGLLGEIYLEQGEGDEIALSLCEKSVELDTHNIFLRLRLAKTQMACQDYASAGKNLKLCLKNRKTHAEAQLQSGLLCRKQGKTKQATTWFARILDRNDVSPKIREAAQYYLKVTS